MQGCQSCSGPIDTFAVKDLTRYVDTSSLEAISISDDEGHRQIITFSDPLMLPPEKSSEAA